MMKRDVRATIRRSSVLSSPALQGLMLRATVVLVVGLPISAQGQDEVEFLTQCGEKLSRHARSVFDAGFPSEARLLWLEVISQYDNDNALARKSLGFVALGKAWAPDLKFQYPDHDKPSPGAAKAASSRWQTVARGLAQDHVEMAKKCAAGDRTERATFHFRRALRFEPGNAAAQQGLAFKKIGALSGTELEQRLYERSMLMKKTVKEQIQKDYKVADHDGKHEYLDKAQLPYIAVKSDNFIIYGNWERDVLTGAAKFAERALAFCKVAFGEVEAMPKTVCKEMAFFKTKTEYQKIIDANKALYRDDDHFKLARDSASASTLGGGRPGALRVGTHGSVQVVHDQTVRWVAWTFGGLQSDAVMAGFGHAVVGTFFGRNLISLLNIKPKQGTVAGEKKMDVFIPDMDAWRELAVELAYRKTSTSAAKLPLLNAAQFPEDGRIKAWSFVDYLIRRDPALVVTLDRCKTSAHENAVKTAFVERTNGLSLDTLEQEWRDFWSGATPVLQALRQRRPPLEAVSAGVDKWVRALSDLRNTHRLTPEQKQNVDLSLRWSANYSSRCKDHCEYLKKNVLARGPEAEHTQELDLGGTEEGRMFAGGALVSTKGDPNSVVEKWMDWPGYRNGILNRRLQAVGIYSLGSIVVVDVIRGAERTGKGVYVFYPCDARNPVSASIKVKDLGVDVVRLLEANKHDKLSVLGYPISLHTYGDYQAGSVTCLVNARAGGGRVEGLLHDAGSGYSRRAIAGGMFVFYPLAPLKKGEYNVSWQFVTRTGEQRTLSSRFTVR